MRLISFGLLFFSRACTLSQAGTKESSYCRLLFALMLPNI
jgi:hypothetical protein